MNYFNMKGKTTKSRKIEEANILLETRFVTEQSTNTDDQKWEKYPCVSKNINNHFTKEKLSDGTHRYYVVVGDTRFSYYNDGIMFNSKTKKKSKYYCKGENVEIVGAEEKSPKVKIYQLPEETKWQYKLENCKWLATKGEKWLPVPEKAVSILDNRFPEAKKEANCNTGSSTNTSQVTKESEAKWAKLNMGCITNSLQKQTRTDGSIIYFDKTNDIVYYGDGFCYMNRQGNKYTVKGKSSCDDNMANCTPIRT